MSINFICNLNCNNDMPVRFDTNIQSEGDCLECIRLEDSLHQMETHVDELYKWIKSDSVLKALDYLHNNKHHFDLEDDDYINLYSLCRQLRKK